MIIQHNCDNPACVNPDHLKLGTLKENYADTVRRHRRNMPHGELHWRAKLDAEKLSEIKSRLAAGETQKAIAESYGVYPSVISRINTGKAWHRD